MGKAFTAPNPKTEYDTFSCKNLEGYAFNSYYSRMYPNNKAH